MASGGDTDFPAKIPRSAADYEKARATLLRAAARRRRRVPRSQRLEPRNAAVACTLQQPPYPSPPSLQVHKVPTAAEYEKLNRPYAAPTEKLPTMSENWSCAPWRGARCMRGR